MSRFKDDFVNVSPIISNHRGAVYYVENKLDKKAYAVRKTNALSESEEQKVLREIRIVNDLVHPNILPYKYYWSETGSNNERRVYIQMELCKFNLRVWFLDNPEHRDRKTQIKILRDIISGVEFVHKNDYMLRNLKPENIFLLDRKFKIGDFELVKQSSKEAHTDLKKGEKRYKSPELLQSSVYTKMVDIYALGVIFFEMLNPNKFESKFIEDKKIKDAKENRFPDFGPEMMQERALISSMLHPDPERRPSAEDILHHPLLTVVKKK